MYLKIKNTGILNVDNIKHIASSTKRYKYIINSVNLLSLFNKNIITEKEYNNLSDNLLNHVFFNDNDFNSSLKPYISNINVYKDIYTYCTNTVIGKYGTGLKQAYCYFLREKMKFIIFSGEEKIVITSVKKISDGFYTDFVRINNLETDLNIAFGIEDYNLPMSISEIWTNALDEGDEERSVVEEKDIIGEAGTTSFYIEINDELNSFINNWNEYFSFERTDVIFESEISNDKKIQIFKKEDNTLFDKLIVYRRGIQVYTYNKQSAFHYRIDDIEITGSRVIKDRFQLDLRIHRILVKESTEEMIVFLLDLLNKHSNKIFEYNLYWSWDGVTDYNNNWSKVLAKPNIVVVESTRADFYNRKTTANEQLYSLPSQMVDCLIKKDDINHLNGKNLLGNKAGLPVELNELENKYWKSIIEQLKIVFWKEHYQQVLDGVVFIKMMYESYNVFIENKILYINIKFLQNSTTENFISELIINLISIDKKEDDLITIETLLAKELIYKENMHYVNTNDKLYLYYYDNNFFIMNEEMETTKFIYTLDIKHQTTKIDFYNLPKKLKDIYFDYDNTEYSFFILENKLSRDIDYIIPF